MVIISKLIASLETSGHTVNCPVTGAFFVDGADCTRIVENPEHDNDTALEAIADLLTNGAAEPDTLLVAVIDDSDTPVTVVDPEGGVWIPAEDAEAEIMAAADPRIAALIVCESSPMRGEWHA